MFLSLPSDSGKNYRHEVSLEISERAQHPPIVVNEKKMRVLVVDDSKLQLKIVSSHLKKWGLDPVQCLSAHDALNACEIQEFDMVISDWVMPEMSGLEFCKAFKAMERDTYGYFILLTVIVISIFGLINRRLSRHLPADRRRKIRLRPNLIR